MLFMDYLKPFSSKALSTIMGDTTGKHVGWKVTASPYRQASIGFRTKNNIAPLELDIQEETMRLIYAQQSGHTLATEERIYGLSPELVEGVSDSTMELYIQSSIDWQNLLGSVPGSVTLPYSQCTSDLRDALLANGTIKTSASATASTVNGNEHLVELLTRAMHQNEASHKLLMDSVHELQNQVNTLQNTQKSVQTQPQFIGSDKTSQTHEGMSLIPVFLPLH